MKYLKLFEDIDWSNLQNFEKYQELTDTLQGEIFDEYNIVYVEDSNIDDDTIAYQGGKCWCYSYTRSGVIIGVDILNLTIEETNEIMKELEDMRDMIYGRSNISYKVTSDEYSSGREEDENPMEDYSTDLRYVSVSIVDGLNKFNESILDNMWTPEQTKKAFTPFINWDLIADAKEISLDYLDKGCSLSIFVNYNKYANETDSIYFKTFNHENEYIPVWQRIFPVNVNPRNIKYRFRIHHDEYHVRHFEMDEIEMSSILSKMYPNENID